MVETPPANAADMGSIPGPGRLHTPRGAHGPQLVSPQAAATEVRARCSLCPATTEPLQGEAGGPRLESGIHLLQRREPTEQEGPHALSRK